MPKKNYQTPTLVSGERANVLDMMKPRLKACVVARLSGLSQRAITQHATNNRIPGAAKLGGLWTFDHDLALQWINEGTRCQTTEISQKRLPAAKHLVLLAAGQNQRPQPQGVASNNICPRCGPKGKKPRKRFARNGK